MPAAGWVTAGPASCWTCLCPLARPANVFQWRVGNCWRKEGNAPGVCAGVRQGRGEGQAKRGAWGGL